MMWSVYIRRGKVFVPSQSKTEAGFYVSGKPVYVVDVADVDGIMQSIIQIIDRGCPVIPTPSVTQLEKWAVLQSAGVASIVTFEKGASCWTIHKDATLFRFGSVMKISPRGWETEPDSPHLLSNNLPIDVIAEEIAKAIAITNYR
jgi:hypothetical protein